MSTTNKILKTPLRISIASLLLGMASRILNWPYAFHVIIASFILIGVLYTIRFNKKENKQTVDYVKMILVVFWTTNGVLKLLDFPYTLFFQIVTAFTFIAWFIMEGTAYFMDEDRKAKNTLIQIIWNVALVLGILATIAGGLLNVLHWEYAMHLLSAGITVITGYILKDLFMPQKFEDKDQNNNGEYQL